MKANQDSQVSFYFYDVQWKEIHSYSASLNQAALVD